MTVWHAQSVVVIGAARQGLALARYLAQGGAHVTLTDQRPAEQLGAAQASLGALPITWVLGGHPFSLLDHADLLCPSGGVPLTLPIIVEAQQRGIPLSNDSQIFLEAAPCPVIGITGSAGKTTTTTLVGRMAQAVKTRRSFVGGNIGTPLISSLAEMTPSDLAVMELSSFQLEIMTRSPQVAAILNITPNHLDRHGTMAAYSAAKAHILAHQDAEDAAVLGREDPGAWGLAGRVHGRLVAFGRDCPPGGRMGTFLREDGWLCYTDGQSTQPLMPRTVIRLRGDHNLLNILAACAIAKAAGLPNEALRAGVEDFLGVAHRLEFVRTWGGAAWYNDSIATAPERSMAAIRAFSEPLVLLVGGRDKDLPWEDFARLVRERVDHVVLFGECAGKVAAVLDAVSAAGDRPYTFEHCAGLQQAVQAAARVVQPGDVVLLSPGGTSFDEFRDFEQRGEAFRQWVLELA
jgi:UDP-N-acetylmuramoylalanine--D-glutamate ligase